MYLPDFDYHSPVTLDEACEILASLGGEGKVLAGGTDVLSRMKSELIAPKALVSLKNIEHMDRIDYVSGKGVVIGAKATHNDLLKSILLQKKYPSIPDAAHSMANNQIRNRGTVGGNLVNAVPSADLPPILIALQAEVTLVGSKGRRNWRLRQISCFLPFPRSCRHDSPASEDDPRTRTAPQVPPHD